jgi:hypothetical protein
LQYKNTPHAVPLRRRSERAFVVRRQKGKGAHDGGGLGRVALRRSHARLRRVRVHFRGAREGGGRGGASAEAELLGGHFHDAFLHGGLATEAALRVSSRDVRHFSHRVDDACAKRRVARRRIRHEVKPVRDSARSVHAARRRRARLFRKIGLQSKTGSTVELSVNRSKLGGKEFA